MSRLWVWKKKKKVSLSAHIFIPQTGENEITISVNMSRLSSRNTESIPGIQSARPPEWLHQFNSQVRILCREQTTAVQGNWKPALCLTSTTLKKHKLDLLFKKKKDECLFEFVSCFNYLAASQLFAELTWCVVWITNDWNVYGQHLHLVMKQ